MNGFISWPMRSLLSIGCASALVVTLPVQTVRADNLFITTDTSVADSVDTNYLVGKDASFNTLAGSVRFNVTGDTYPDLANPLVGPYGHFLYGVTVFGSHGADISGSTQVLAGYDQSRITLAGGFSQNYSGYDSARYTINGGTSNNTRGYFNSRTDLNSGQVNTWQSFQNATLNVAGGTVTDATLSDTSVLNLSGGTISHLTVNPGSVVNVTGGSITHRSGSGTVNFSDVVLPTIQLTSGTTTTLNNVTTQTITVRQDAKVTLTNDSTIPVVDLVEARDRTVIQGDSGNVRTATALDQAWFVMNGIEVSSLSLFDTSRLDVISGYIGAAQLMGRNEVMIAGGTVSSIVIDGTTLTASQVEMTGGTVEAMAILGNVQTTITGGLIGSLSIVAESVATILGGTIEPNTIRLFDRGVLNLHGRDLMLSLAGFGTDSQGDFTRYRLSGTLSNGDVLAGINVLSYDGALAVGDPSLGAANAGSVRFFSAAVPEPATVSLLCLTLIGMVAAKRRAARRGSAPTGTQPFNTRSRVSV